MGVARSQGKAHVVAPPHSEIADLAHESSGPAVSPVNQIHQLSGKHTAHREPVRLARPRYTAPPLVHLRGHCGCLSMGSDRWCRKLRHGWMSVNRKSQEL